MTTNDTSPRPGLTRTDTGYPAWPLHPGWFWTPAEVRRIEARAARRVREDGRVVDEVIIGSPIRAVAPNVTPMKTTGRKRA